MPQRAAFHVDATFVAIEPEQFSSTYFCRSIRGRNTDGIEIDLFPPVGSDPFWVGVQYQRDKLGRWRVTADLRFVIDNYGDLVLVQQ